jgi:dCMP deaminase
MRPTKDVWALAMARLTAQRGTCARRQVGCVLTDARGHVLATGYNGRPRGFPHCNEGNPCLGATAATGTSLDLCEAVHAEQNALLQCHDVELIDACYVTVSPCITCVKLLLNTGCRRIIAAAAYAHDAAARDLWLRTVGRTWQIIPEEDGG